MAEQSFLFDFARVDSFIENINVAFFIEEMWRVTGINTNGSYKYPQGETWEDAFELMFIEYGENNISSYLTEDGLLDETKVDGIHKVDCSLDYYDRGDGEATIELHGDVVFNVGDVNVPLKAVLLRNKSTGYIMGYSINKTPFSVTNQVVFDDDVIFWDISRFNQ